MEEIYLKGFTGGREWCSDKVQLKKYFTSYSNQLSLLSIKKITELDILNYFVPESNNMLEDELLSLADITNGSQLTSLSGKDLTKLNTSSKNKLGASTSSNTDLNESTDILNNSNKKRPRNRVKNENNKSRKEVLLNAAEKLGPRNLVVLHDYMVSFRIHSPFSHTIGDNSRPGRCVQQIDVLGSQTLDLLRDKIICETDFQDTRGDISTHPDKPVTKRARDVYRSSMFYFDNTFYVDFRDSSNIDYSATITSWARERGIQLGETKSMESAVVGDLKMRFGYPYLYRHQGCCEHLIVISDARLLTMKDSLCSQDYPLISKITHNNMVYCMTCSRFPARWIVRNSDRLAHDPTYQCKSCFKLLHYINGKKVCNFRAYQYWQRSTII